MNIHVSKEELDEQSKYAQLVKEQVQGKKYYIETMGCQLNENDSEKLAGMLENMGYVYTDDDTKANVVIMNTCCIRENAENRVFGKLGELKNRHKTDDLIIGLCGCMMQEEHIIEKIKKSYNYVDIIFGTHTLHKLPELIYNTINGKIQCIDIEHIDGKIVEGLPIKHESTYKANVTITYGCNNFCSYCIVPYVRGRERSRDLQDILAEIQCLAQKGYKEITLLGQNVNSYGKDLDDTDANFANLLYKINEIDGIEIIKFLSPHPKDFTDDVIEAIKNCNKVSRVIHLPLQSGSTEILKSMNRKYTKEQFLTLAKKIKTAIPEIGITTDIIVGFPGETEENFKDTLDVIEKVQFDQVFMFIYSRRVGTVADKMENQIDENIKGERLQRVKELVSKVIEEKNEKYINTIHEILVEGKSKNNEEMYTGRTKDGKILIFEAEDSLIGKMVNVKITENHLWYLTGEIVK